LAAGQTHGGQFVLRIDDTDAEPTRFEALQPILDGFRWLGLQWHEGRRPAGRMHRISIAAKKIATWRCR